MRKKTPLLKCIINLEVFWWFIHIYEASRLMQWFNFKFIKICIYLFTSIIMGINGAHNALYLLNACDKPLISFEILGSFIKICYWLYNTKQTGNFL